MNYVIQYGILPFTFNSRELCKSVATLLHEYDILVLQELLLISHSIEYPLYTPKEKMIRSLTIALLTNQMRQRRFVPPKKYIYNSLNMLTNVHNKNQK